MNVNRTNPISFGIAFSLIRFKYGAVRIGKQIRILSSTVHIEYAIIIQCEHQIRIHSNTTVFTKLFLGLQNLVFSEEKILKREKL